MPRACFCASLVTGICAMAPSAILISSPCASLPLSHPAAALLERGHRQLSDAVYRGRFPLLGASGRVWGGALLGRDASEGPRQCARHRRAKTAVGSPAAARVGVDEETSIASARAEMVDVTMSLTGDGDVDEDKVHAEPAQIPRVGANKTGGGGNPIFVSPGHKISVRPTSLCFFLSPFLLI